MSTGIEWTDETWNPTTGCTKVSPGCDHCYAEVMYERFNGKGSFATVKMHSQRLGIPVRWRRPRKVFVNSMSDLFHQDVTDFFIAEVFAVMATTPRHTYQILTKRHARMRALLSTSEFRDLVDEALRVRGKDPLEGDGPVVLPNVWLGVSVEDQKWADIRIPALLDTPAAIRWLSCEPLLGQVSLFANAKIDTGTLVDWVVVGGESGHGARPMNPSWARHLRYECATYGIPFLYKQHGAWMPAPWKLDRITGESDDAYKARSEAEGATHGINPLGYVVQMDHKPWSLERGPHAPAPWVGIRKAPSKKVAGRELDGRTWDEYPAVAS
jgi:protein gp37